MRIVHQCSSVRYLQKVGENPIIAADCVKIHTCRMLYSFHINVCCKDCINYFLHVCQGLAGISGWTGNEVGLKNGFLGSGACSP